MNISQILAALGAYLSGAGLFRFGKYLFTIQNTGNGPVKFSYNTALKAIEASALTNGQVFPRTVVIGSTSVTISLL
jgi:hypothetical protein